MAHRKNAGSQPVISYDEVEQALYSAKSMGLETKEIDPHAWTATDIKNMRGGNTQANCQYIRDMVASGKWEQVYKMQYGRRCKAYRRKRKEAT